MIERKDSMIVEAVTRAIVPAMQVFALYVVFHGHYSPGGGFQGGALLAASVLLQRIVLGMEGSVAGFPVKWGTPFGVAGVLIFAGVGVWAMPTGGNFLQYDALPWGMSAVWLRNTGILVIEVGVAFAVMGTLVSIYDDLVGGARGDDDEGEAGRG